MQPIEIPTQNPETAERGAAGWSLLYMLFGGGILGAIVIFIVLKAIGA